MVFAVLLSCASFRLGLFDQGKNKLGSPILQSAIINRKMPIGKLLALGPVTGFACLPLTAEDFAPDLAAGLHLGPLLPLTILRIGAFVSEGRADLALTPLPPGV
jgi:hypothetical protein